MRSHQVLRSLLVMVPLAFGGCVAVGGNDNYTQPTLGRQLQDLKVARDTGAMNDAEYADAKSKLVNGDLPRKK